MYILTVAMGRILEASLAYYMNPLFSVLIGAIFFKEKLSKVQWLSGIPSWVRTSPAQVKMSTWRPTST